MKRISGNMVKNAPEKGLLPSFKHFVKWNSIHKQKIEIHKLLTNQGQTCLQVFTGVREVEQRDLFFSDIT